MIVGCEIVKAHMRPYDDRTIHNVVTNLLRTSQLQLVHELVDSFSPLGNLCLRSLTFPKDILLPMEKVGNTIVRVFRLIGGSAR